MPCDGPSECLGILTLICHLADFTNTFRSLASVQPEDSSDDLPGPLQEVGAAYCCLSHYVVCPLTPVIPCPLAFACHTPAPKLLPLAPYRMPCLFSAHRPSLFRPSPPRPIFLQTLPVRSSPSATVHLQPLPVPAQATASWYEDAGSCFAHHNTADLVSSCFRSCMWYHCKLQCCCAKHQYSHRGLHDSYPEAVQWCSTI